MEGVNHVDVTQVSRCRLISDVDRMLQRQIPDREGFKLRIAYLASLLIFMVKLRKAGGQFPRPAARSCNHHQRFAYLNIRVNPVALLTDDGLYVGRISLGIIMLIGFDVSALQLVNEHIHRRCVLIACDDHAVDSQVMLAEDVDEPQHLQIIGDTEVLARFTADDISRINADDDLCLILHAFQ